MTRRHATLAALALSLVAACCGAAYVGVVSARVLQIGATHLGGDTIVLVYGLFTVGAISAVPAVRSHRQPLPRAGKLLVLVNVGLLGGWIASHAAMLAR